MGNKIKLGQRPDTFKPFPVRFEMPEGGDGEISCTYRYRTAKEYGALVDEMSAANQDETSKGVAEGAADKEAGAAVVQPFSWEKEMTGSAKSKAAFLHKALASWDLDIDLTLDNLEQLATELPAAANAMLSAYATACRDGRLGN